MTANYQYYVVVKLVSPPACHGLLGAGQEESSATVSPHLDASYNWLETETEQLFILTLMYCCLWEWGPLPAGFIRHLPWILRCLPSLLSQSGRRRVERSGERGVRGLPVIPGIPDWPPLPTMCHWASTWYLCFQSWCQYISRLLWRASLVWMVGTFDQWVTRQPPACPGP